MTSIRISLAIAIACAAGAGTASAQPGAAPVVAPVEPVPAKIWYGWQIMVIDVTAVAVLLAETDTAELVPYGLTIYAVGGPTVHLIHGNPGRAGLSLGIRLSAPLISALVGSALAQSENDECCDAGLILGAGAGILAASIVDWAVLGYETPRQTTEPAVAPSVWGTARGELSFGLAGQF